MFCRRHVWTLSAALLVSLAGCATDDVGVSTTFDPLAPFPLRATYAWDDRASSSPDDASIGRLDLDTLLKDVADEEFGARGYSAVASGSVHYRLSYQLTVSTWIRADKSRSTGSLSLMMVDAGTNRRVWVGFARAEIHVGLTRTERRERLHKVVARMLEKFPPTQRGD